jgi:heme/copper-type cytochrome/quinol oxidase subunit 3
LVSLFGFLITCFIIRNFAENGAGPLPARTQALFINLMYLLLSGAVGWNATKAPRSPTHKGWSIYLSGVLIILTLFDFYTQYNGTPVSNSTTPVSLQSGSTGEELPAS